MGLRNSIESPRPDGERIRVRGSRSRSVSAASGGAAAPPPHLPAASRRAPPSPDRGEGAKRRDKAERDPIGYLFGPDHEIREERFGAAFGGRLAVVDAPCGSGGPSCAAPAAGRCEELRTMSVPLYDRSHHEPCATSAVRPSG